MKKILGLLVFLLLAIPAMATTTVTGKIQNLGTGNITSNAFVRFWLRGCAGNQPRISGTSIIGPTQGGVYYFDMAADSSGNVSGTLYSTRDSTGLLGGEIECGGSTTAVWYGMQVWVNGKAGPEIPIHAKNGVTLDVTQVTPISTNPVVTSPTGDTTYLRIDAGNSPVTGNVQFTGTVSTTNTGTHSGTETFANINKVVYADQQTGATADLKIVNCLASLTSGGICDARGFGATTQSIASQVVVGAGKTLIFDPATTYQAASSSLGVMVVQPGGTVTGFTFDCTNQPTFSGVVIQNDTSAAYGNGPRTTIDNITINQSCSAVTTGIGFALNSTAAASGVSFVSASHWKINGLGTGMFLTSSGTGFVTGNHFEDWVVNYSPIGYSISPTGSGIVQGNEFMDTDYELSTCAGACVGFQLTGNTTQNKFDPINSWDTIGAAVPIKVQASGVVGNTFAGRWEGTPTDTFGNNSYYGFSNRPDGTSGNLLANAMASKSQFRATQFIADQGSACTNGELALSAGWQSTGTATVTGVVGTGQTCEWTITTGTTTAANPTVTDTLTNALPSASTVCWMIITGGTRTAAAGDSFDQTTLSATAPVFTFQGTPTAAGKTYKVVRTCGP